MSENDDSGFDLTRRKVLGGLAGVGVASGAAGAGTMALFSDTEQSTGNTIQAGTLDLKAEGGDSAVTTFDLSNKAPGDSGTASTNVSNAGSLDGYLAFTVGDATNSENGTPTDPEQKSSLENGGEPGELGKWLKLRMGYAADGSSSLDPSEVAVEGYLTGSDSGFPNTGGMEQVRFNQNALLSAGADKDFVVEWEIDPDAGNEVQTDIVTVPLRFELQQQQAARDVVLDGDTIYAQGKGWDGFETTTEAAHVGDGSWQAETNNDQEGLWFGADYSDIDPLPIPTVSEVEELSYWMKHAESTLENDFYLQIFTKPRGDGSDSVVGGSWFNAKYTAVPPNANNGSPNWTPGEWNKFGTASGATNQLYFYLGDDASTGLHTLSDITSGGTWTKSGYKFPKSDDEVLGFAILTNSTQNDFTGYLDDLYLETSAGSVSFDLEP